MLAFTLFLATLLEWAIPGLCSACWGIPMSTSIGPATAGGCAPSRQARRGATPAAPRGDGAHCGGSSAGYRPSARECLFDALQIPSAGQTSQLSANHEQARQMHQHLHYPCDI